MLAGSPGTVAPHRNLPSIDSLLQNRGDFLREFKNRVSAAGLTERRLPKEFCRHESLPPRLQLPMLMWNARRRDDAYGSAYRLLVLREALDLEDVISFFGKKLSEDAIAVGLFLAWENKVQTPFDWRLYHGFLVLSDVLEANCIGAVFGIGPGTNAFANFIHTSRKVDRALDLGCGAGAVGMWMSRFANSVVATDVNPRALQFARINAAMNDVHNIEFRAGDWFAPVRGEAFDIVASQPPYVPTPDGYSGALYRFGGRTGGEAVEAVFTGISSALSASGHAVIVFEVPEYESLDTDWLLRVCRTEGCSVSVILGASASADDYSIRFGATELGGTISDFDRAATTMREHLGSLGVSGIRPAVAVIQADEHKARTVNIFGVENTLWDEISLKGLRKMSNSNDGY